ncbi:MAG: hypothetical protein QME75_12405 [Deltaproteobacteria bacterium]|nr:hypothetical protein [Deltaproteobacteria bacterium]
MARIFIDGFESGQLNLWDGVVGATVVAAQSGMDGSYCLDCYSAGTAQKYVKKNISALSEIFIGFRWMPKNANRFLSFYNGSTLLGKLHLSGNGGNIVAYRGSTSIATGTETINYNSVYLIEVRYKPDDSAGVFQVKVNGVTDIDFSGDTTPGATTVDNFWLSHNDNNFPSGYFDNVVVDDADWPGNTRIAALKPIGAGSLTQWDPSAGSNWDCVDEVPASDSDYISTDAAEEVDLFAAADLPANAYSVKCVQVQARALKEGNSLNVQNLQLACRTNLNDYFSENFAVPTSAKSFAKLWQNNPNTAQPWTKGEVDAMEIGVKAVA